MDSVAAANPAPSLDDLRGLLRHAEEAVAEEKEALGVNLLDGGDGDPAPLDRAEAEVVRLCAAIEVASRRARERDAGEAAARRRSLLDEANAAEHQRLEAVTAAERAARELVAQLVRVDQKATEIARRLKEAGIPVPIGLERVAVQRRLSEHLCALFRVPALSNGQFGTIRFGQVWRDPADDWTAAERREGERSLPTS